MCGTGSAFITYKALYTRDIKSRVRRVPILPSYTSLVEGHEMGDSILAECSRTSPHHKCAVQRHREFIVFDKTQCYPEVLITYKRV